MAVVADTTQSQASPLTFTILEGPNATTDIQLIGRALPYRAVPFEGKQRVKTTYYPGNPVATQQVMGPTEEPTTFNGIWKDIFLGNGAAKRLVDTFDDLRRSGFSVLVSWGSGKLADGSDIPPVPQDNGKEPTTPRWPIQRRGIIQSFKATYDRPQDITWEMTVAWAGRNEPTAPPFTAAGIINNRDGFDVTVEDLSDTKSKLQAFAESVAARITGFPAQVSARLDTAEEGIQTAIGFIESTTITLQGISQIPSLTLERGRAIFDQAAGALLNLKDTLLGNDQITRQPTDSALTYLDGKTQLFTVLDSTDISVETCSNTRNAIEKQMRPTVLAEVRPIPGTDLRDLARQYYGDPDLWYIIANFNDLTSSRVPDYPDGASDNPGAPIRVPQQPQGIDGVTSPSC